MHPFHYLLPVILVIPAGQGLFRIIDTGMPDKRIMECPGYITADFTEDCSAGLNGTYIVLAA